MFGANSKTERRSICQIDWTTVKLACEQALVFGWAKQAARESLASGKAVSGRGLGLFSSPPPLRSRLFSRASRASTFNGIPQMESLLAVYSKAEHDGMKAENK